MSRPRQMPLEEFERHVYSAFCKVEAAGEYVTAARLTAADAALVNPTRVARSLVAMLRRRDLVRTVARPVSPRPRAVHRATANTPKPAGHDERLAAHEARVAADLADLAAARLRHREGLAARVAAEDAARGRKQERDRLRAAAARAKEKRQSCE